MVASTVAIDLGDASKRNSTKMSRMGQDGMAAEEGIQGRIQ